MSAVIEHFFPNILSIDYLLVCLCALPGTVLKNKYFFTKLCGPTIWNNTFDMIWLNIIEHICQHLEHRLGFGVSVCPLGHRDEEKMLSTGFFVADNLKRKWLFGVFVHFWDFTEGVILSKYKDEFLCIVHFTMLVPNCQFSYLWCQIVGFSLLVANCPLLLSWCQIVVPHLWVQLHDML